MALVTDASNYNDVAVVAMTNHTSHTLRMYSKGDLLCWLRLGWLNQVCVHLRSYDTSAHKPDLNYQ